MKYAEVKWYLKYGQEVKRLFKNIRPIGETVGYFHPSQANWSWEEQLVSFEGKLYMVLVRFGSVEGGKEVILFDNTNKAGL